MQAQKCPIFSPIAVDSAQLPDFLNISQLSVICGLSVSTIRNHCRKGLFPQPVKFSPKKLFWRKCDIVQLLSQLEKGERNND